MGSSCELPTRHGGFSRPYRYFPRAEGARTLINGIDLLRDVGQLILEGLEREVRDTPHPAMDIPPHRSRLAHTSCLLRRVRRKTRGRRHSMTIMTSASRAVQEPAASPIQVTGPGSGSAFSDRTYAKQRHACHPRPARCFSSALAEVPAPAPQAEGTVKGRQHFVAAFILQLTARALYESSPARRPASLPRFNQPRNQTDHSRRGSVP